MVALEFGHPPLSPENGCAEPGFVGKALLSIFLSRIDPGLSLHTAADADVGRSGASRDSRILTETAQIWPKPYFNRPRRLLYM